MINLFPKRCYEPVTGKLIFVYSVILVKKKICGNHEGIKNIKKISETIFNKQCVIVIISLLQQYDVSQYLAEQLH